MEKIPSHHLPGIKSRIAYVGPSESGKSSIMNIVIQKTAKLYGWDNIYLFSPTAFTLDDSYDNLQIPEDNIFSNYKTETLLKLVDNYKEINIKRKRNGKKPINWLVILDDCITYLKNTDNKLIDLLFKLRHYNCSLHLASQQYFKIPKAIRCNLSGLFIQVADILNQEKTDIIKESRINSKVLSKIIDTFGKKKYNNLYFDNKNKKIYLNLEKEILIK